MEQINSAGNNGTPPTMPVKRKRGRPRKDKSIKDPMQITPRINYAPPLNSAGEAHGSLVGQSVTGVVEASFDAGFLLNVNIGNSGTCLRGVVFKPGYYHPVCAKNDVAPHVQKINRNEIPLSKQNENRQYVVNTDGKRNGQLSNNESILELKSSRGKDKKVSVVSLSSVPLRGTVKSVHEAATMIPNGVSQNRGPSESKQSDSNGISGPNEANKRNEVSSQSSEGCLENGDYTNKPHDLEPLSDVHSLNNHQSQETPQPYNNSRMGPMSMLLQVVQEKMMKPRGSS